jgi:hypothetical protein
VGAVAEVPLLQKARDAFRAFLFISSGEPSPDQKELTGLDELSRLQPVEVHTTRKIRTLPAGQAGVELDLVNSRVHPRIHQD